MVVRGVYIYLMLNYMYGIYIYVYIVWFRFFTTTLKSQSQYGEAGALAVWRFILQVIDEEATAGRPM